MTPEFHPAGNLYTFEYGDRAGLPAHRSQQGLFARYKAIALSLVLSLIYLNLPNYAESVNGAILPKYFYFGFVLILAPFLLSKAAAIATYLLSPFALWAIVLVVLDVVYLLSAMADGDAKRAELISTRIQYIVLAIFLGFAICVTRTTAYQRVLPVLALLIPSTVILDFLVPGLLRPFGVEGMVSGRAAGTFIDPNIAGEVILVVFLLACAVVKKSYRTPLFILAGAGAMLTFSRSAIVGWILLWLYLMVRRALPNAGTAFVLLAACVPLTIGGFQAYLNNRADFALSIGDLESRVSFFSSPNLDDESGQERLAVLKAGWDLFLQNPVAGVGAGMTEATVVKGGIWPYDVGIHNQPVTLAAEFGIAGLFVCGALAVLLWRGKYFQDKTVRSAMFFLIVFMSMFTHNMFDFPYWLVTFALISGRRRL
jgi:hypothetical protein